jgi:hypothetical protein
MAFRVNCPGCRTSHDIPEQGVGQRFRCKKCGTAFQVSQPKSAAPGPRPATEGRPASTPRPPAGPPAPPAKTPVQPQGIDLSEFDPDKVVLPILELAEEEEGLQTRPRQSPPPPRPAQRSRPEGAGREGARTSPSRRQAQPVRARSSSVWVWVALVVTALVLVGAGAGLAVYLSGEEEPRIAQTDPKPEQKRGEKPDNKLPENGGNQPGDNQPGQKPERPPVGGPPGPPPLIPPVQPPLFPPVPPGDKPRAPAEEPVAGSFVRIPAAALPIKPPVLRGEKVSLPLPSSVRDVCVGGGGRFLILHLPQQRKLAVFDANEGKVVKYLPVASDNIKFAAGMDRLVVVLPDTNIIQRWNLRTFEKEVTAPLALKSKPHLILMGSATDGPLVCGMSMGLAYLDVQTLKEVKPAREQGGGRGLNFDPGWHPMTARISADGRVLGAWHQSLSPSGLNSVVVTGNTVRGYSEHTSVGYILPGPNGKTLFTSSGLYTAEVKKIGDGRQGSVLPALHGSSYLSLRREGGRFPGEGTMRVAVHMLGDSRPLVTLNDLDGLEAPGRFGLGGASLPLDKRLFLIPQAKLVVVVPHTADRLLLHRFDLDEALEKSGIDYLLVTSQPVTGAARGKRYQYQLAVKSKKGGVKFKLESGPKGMSVTPRGKLTWNVPRDHAENEADIILTVSDASGQEIFHTFKLAIKDRVANLPAPPVQADHNPPKPPENKPVEVKLPDRPDEPPARVAAGAIEIRPCPIKADSEERRLPSTVHDLTIGGGGRFVILSLPATRQIAVFDVNEAKVVKYLPLAEDRAVLAAGLDKLFVCLPDANVIQRWSLRTFQRDLTVASPLKGRLSGACMGWASDGPLLLFTGSDGGEARFVDTRTLKPLDLQEGSHPFQPRFGPLVRPSGDGSVFAWMDRFRGACSCVVRDGKVTTYRGETSSVLVAPGADGSFICSMVGVYTTEMKPVFPEGKHGNIITSPFIASKQGRLFMRIGDGSHDAKKQFRFYLFGNSRPLVTMPNLAGFDGQKNTYGEEAIRLSSDKRYLLLPDSRVLVALAPTNDRLILKKFDIDDLLEKSGIDYLLVTSRPPLSVGKGQALSYRVAVKSKKGGVKLKLESGPAGMRLGADGKLIWAVPRDFAEKTVDVILTVSDAAGQEIFHNFTLAIKDQGADLPALPVQGGLNPPKPPENKPVAVKPPIRPAVPVGGIHPAPLKKDQEERALPSAVGDVCVGGGGRFLILHLPKERKLAVFDVNEAKMVKYLPVAEDDIKFAAGRDKLIVALPTANVLQRWSLSTFERELTVPSPASPIKGLAMGSACDDPLILASGGERWGGQLLFLDPRTFKPSAVQIEGGAGRLALGFDFSPSLIRVSANGQVIVGGRSTLVRQGQSYKAHRSEVGGLPSADGRTLFTTGRLYTAEGKPLGEYVGGHGKMVWYVPALHGPFYVSLNEIKKPGWANSSLSLSVHLVGDGRPLVTLPNVEAIQKLVDWVSGGHPPFERHVFLIPEAKLLLIIPMTRDRLVLHRFDFDQMLAKSEVDYLFVQSQPVTTAVRGQDYVYPLVIRSKKGGVKLKLDSGPRGMKVTPEGKLTWAVPADQATDAVDVILTVSDASGQEVFHTFAIAVRDRGEAQKAERVPPAKPEPPKPPAEPKPVEPKKPETPKIEEPKPGAEAKPPPASPVGAIKPAPLKEDREERTLPSTVDDACIGGGGRFFILHLPKSRKLAIFDVNETKVIKYLAVADDNVKFTAGMSKLFVVFPDRGIIQRFSLSTFEKEVTAPLPFQGSVKAITTGSAASGPLLVHYNQGSDALNNAPVTFLDPVSFKELALRGRAVPRHSVRDSYHYRASPDGTVFGGWVTSHTQSMSSIVLAGSSAKVHGGEMAGSVVPGADNTLVTAGGLYTPECKSLSGDKATPRYRLRVPSQTGRFYITCPGGGGAQINTGTDAGKPVEVYLMGDARPIATLRDLELPTSNEAWTGSDFTQDRRVLFVPEGKLIAIIPRSNDRLVLHRFNIDRALDKAGVDYLFVTSQPLTEAVRGKVYRYDVAVKSKKGGVKFKLESGPKGMSVTPAGKLLWNVPKDHAGNEADVILTVSDASGQEIFHTFKISVRDP